MSLFEDLQRRMREKPTRHYDDSGMARIMDECFESWCSLLDERLPPKDVPKDDTKVLVNKKKLEIILAMITRQNSCSSECPAIGPSDSHCDSYCDNHCVDNLKKCLGIE